MKSTVGLISLGCPKNLVDSEIMLGLLEEAGFRIVVRPEEAEVLIVNTCGFIEDAKRESIETIVEMAQFKKNGKTKILVVSGCLPQRYKDQLTEEFPEVDLFIGTGEYHKIVQLIDKLCPKKRGTKFSQKVSINVPKYIHTAKTPRKVSTAKHSIYIKIAEGCFHACSFCAIPKMRGGYRSRGPSDILVEAKSLVLTGAKELNLIAQDTTAYGRDLKNTNIVKLVETLAKNLPDTWIRVLYLYPQSFKKDLIFLMKEYKNICKYIDIPIQHVDDEILQRMGRGRSEGLVRSLVEYIKTELPSVAIRTSVISGFPGETKKQHKKLVNFIGKGFFDHVGVFTYSEEEGTPAARLKGHIPEKMKKERQREIMMRQKGVSRKKLAMKVGESMEVLIDGVEASNSRLFQGRGAFQAPDIDGMTYVEGSGAKIGEFYSVEITGSYDYDLIGRIV